MTTCQLPEEDREIWSQCCVAYETFSLLVPDNDLDLLELIVSICSWDLQWSQEKNRNNAYAKFWSDKQKVLWNFFTAELHARGAQ